MDPSKNPLSAFESMADAGTFLARLFERSPVAFQIYRADGHCLLVNAAFRKLFGSAPPAEYNVLKDELLERQGLLEFVRRAFAGETLRVPAHWYDARELEQVAINEGRRVGLEATLLPLADATGRTAYVAVCFTDVSAELELRETTQALLHSQERFRATFEQAAVGMAHVAPDGRWLEVNQRLCEIVGYERAELLERTVQDVTYFADLQSDMDLIRKILAGELATGDKKTRCVRKDGSLVWIDLTVSLVRDETGVPRYFIAAIQDISTNVENDARKSAILEAAIDCIVSMDHSGVITEFNPAAERTFGYARAEVLGKPLVELLIPPSLRQRHLDGLQRYLTTGVGPILGTRVQLPALRADGTEFPVELTVVSTPSNGPPSFTAYMRDLTAQQQAARALELSEARFRHLAESGIIGIILTDTLGNIHDANDAFLEMVKFTRDDLVSGKVRWTELTPPEWRELDLAAIEQLAATGVARPWEKEYVRKDGTRVPVLVGVAMLEAPRCIAFVLDLTEQRRAEEIRARAVARAERESAGRQRAEAALRQIEERLQQSHRMDAIGGLAGSIAHDFNNLLSVILSYGEMSLEQVKVADPMHSDLEQIVLAGRRAQNLTQQLLAFGRRQLLKPKLLNLSDLVVDMSTMLRRLIGEDVELLSLLAPGAGLVLVDPSQMEQVLLNLVVNARDAMPRGGKLTIETAAVELDRTYASEHVEVEPGSYVRLCVSDTGIGMDRSTQARIFEPFFTTKPKGRGTGLGLSTVFGIVKQSGGHLWVYSEPNKGSTFKVYLPRMDANGDAEQTVSPPPSKVDGSETVLLVEDDDQVRSLATSILRRNGYRVLDASSGGEALLICEQEPGTIDLLLTDVVMPRMSGRELWERLAPLRPGMKVLFMSGYTDDAIVHHGILSSELAFVQKPLTPGTLLERVRQVLDEKA